MNGLLGNLLLNSCLKGHISGTVRSNTVGTNNFCQLLNGDLLTGLINIVLGIFPRNNFFIFCQVDSIRSSRQIEPIRYIKRGIQIVPVCILERNMRFCQFRIFCKRCKRDAHDEHESGRQQSQQTSFEVRFLHVNFSYSLKFI